MYNFIANNSRGDDLDVLRNMSWDEGTVACTRHTWVWAMYCQLKMRGIPVALSDSPKSDAINIIHGEVARQQLNAVDFRKYFIIAIRADFRPFPYSQFEIVQNEYSEGGRRIYMPLFPQPGLIARDPKRDQVVNVCVSGRMQNSVDLERLKNDLHQMKCHFVFRGEGQWQDMFDVDILLGIRSFSKDPQHSKPATKLFNAWLAGIPFIGGYDSAFEQVGSPGESYIRISSYNELIEAIRSLSSDSDLYRKLVENGKKAGVAYTPERITDLWVEVFETRFVPAYRIWRDIPSGISRLACFFRGKQFFLREKIFAPVMLWLKQCGK